METFVTKFVLFIVCLVYGCVALGLPAYYVSVGSVPAGYDLPVQGYVGSVLFLLGIPALMAAGVCWSHMLRAIFE